MTQQLKLIITINPDGSVSVNGPINDKVICYGMLEAAKDAIREHHARLAIANADRIIPARQIPKTN